MRPQLGYGRRVALAAAAVLTLAGYGCAVPGLPGQAQDSSASLQGAKSHACPTGTNLVMAATTYRHPTANKDTQHFFVGCRNADGNYVDGSIALFHASTSPENGVLFSSQGAEGWFPTDAAEATLDAAVQAQLNAIGR